ncbi:MAG: tetratricopeptide repeat protein [Candidatus Wallbacteria bacterium]
MAYYELEDYDKAMNDNNTAIELNSESAELYYNRGITRRRQCFDAKVNLDEKKAAMYLDMAIQNFNKAIEIDPKYFKAYCELGKIYSDVNYDKAVQYYDKAIELNPAALQIYYDRGNSYQAKKDYENAINDYSEAIKLKIDSPEMNSTYSEVYNNRGYSYYQKEKYDDAINDFTEAIKLNPKYAEAYYNRGIAYNMKKNKNNSAADYENALKDFGSAITLKPDYYEAYYRRGNAYMDKGANDAAIKDYSKAIEINPNYSNTYNARGVALEFNNDNAGALKDYGKALELDPKNSSARHNLNTLNEKLGKNQPKSDSTSQTPDNKTAEIKPEQKFNTAGAPLSSEPAGENAGVIKQTKADNKLKNSARRYALIIGNSEYAENKLINTVNDARLMEKTLKKCGFDVTSGENLNKKKIKELVRSYVSKLDKDSAALFFYSGHGVQYNGENYLVPLEFDLKNEHEIEDECVNANWVIEEIGTGRPGITIIILDACRNNPFGKGFKRSLSHGLASVDHPAQGTLIAYSTSPNQTASDGDGQNSPYTEALVNNILKPGIDILKVFQQTRKEVYSRTKEQLPWENQSLMDDFYFIEK